MPDNRQWQTLLCITSIQKYCKDDYQIYCYTEETYISQLHPFTNNYLSKHHIPIHDIVKNHNHNIPLAAFALMDTKREPAEYCIYMDHATILCQNTLFSDICVPNTIRSLPMLSAAFSGDKDKWVPYYKHFGAGLPQTIVFNDGKSNLPYFKTEFICLPESSSFPKLWVDTFTGLIDANILNEKKVNINQISYTVATQRSSLKKDILDSKWSFNVNRHTSIPLDTNVLYYKKPKWIYVHKLNETLINSLIQEYLELDNLAQLKDIIANPNSVENIKEKIIGKRKEIISHGNKPILFLHMGIHRTGTTTVQDILSYNRENLLSQGVLYPKLGDRSSNSSLAWKFLRNRITGNELLELFYKEAKDFNAVILSDEDFCQTWDNTWLKSLNDVFDIRVIIYLRRQDRWINSWYNQHIRWPWNKKFSSATPDFFVENLNDFYWIDYEKLLSQIEEVIPQDNLHIQIIDPLGIKDTTTDMLAYIGVECISRKDILRTNASISALKLDLLRRIDLMSLNGGNTARLRILNAIKNINIKKDNGNQSVLTYEQATQILEKFKGSNSKVAKKYFGRENLFSPLEQKEDKEILLSTKDANHYLLALLKEIASLQNIK